MKHIELGFDAAPPPDYSIGFPSRDPDLDVLPGFKSPPPGYGEVAFYWWLGDPLTRERIKWQMDRLKGRGVMGLQVNYAHSNKGGLLWGLTYPSKPALFSEEWWELFGWFMKEARKNGMAVSLSDYTLGIGQGAFMDEILQNNPDIIAASIENATKPCEGGTEFTWELPDHTAGVTAFRILNGGIVPGSGKDLRKFITGNFLQWRAPAGQWHVVASYKKSVPFTYDPMDPRSGAEVVKTFFQRFEDHNPGESGKGLNFFFSDELNFNIRGWLWNDAFASEFIKRKGYDVVPELAALRMDIGPRTPKIRLDVTDVILQLSEVNYFRPVFDWHQQRGIIYGCDHGGRGRDVTEFGDYFRTQRWNQGPGCDQPTLTSDMIKNKVASSIAHLYQRPKVWLEGFHSSGWGTSSAQVTDATFRNFAMGQNLLTLHGLYYSTHGGWWEWAPPCNHWRMPYWEHLVGFLRCSERLSYLLSQGIHKCDVAIVYPVAPMEADLGGNKSVETAFRIGEAIYGQGIDFDFIDFESLARAKPKDGELRVAGEAYRVLIIPAMAALRDSTIRQALKFYQAGGIVIAQGALPEASDRIGRADAKLDEMVKELFGLTAAQAKSGATAPPQRNKAGGIGLYACDTNQTIDVINDSIVRDYIGPGYVLHRKIGPRDVFMVVHAPKGAECFFKATGTPELWDPWSGKTRPIHVFQSTEGGTRMRLPLEITEANVIVFSPEKPALSVQATDLEVVTRITAGKDEVAVNGLSRSGGVKSAFVRVGGRKPVRVEGVASEPPTPIKLDGMWEFELQPTMDNEWGDFHQPPSKGLIGAEARQFRYAEERTPVRDWQSATFDDCWRGTTCEFGPKFWVLTPPDRVTVRIPEAELVTMQSVDPTVRFKADGGDCEWRPYDFSWRWGIENDSRLFHWDPSLQGHHGLKELIYDDFMNIERPCYMWTSVLAPSRMQARLNIKGLAPAAIWINGQQISDTTATVTLEQGANSLLLRYGEGGRGHIVLEDAAEHREKPPFPLSTSWYRKPGVLQFDLNAGSNLRACWYRFTSPPGFRSMKFKSYGKVEAWANGRPMRVKAGKANENGAQEVTAVAMKPDSMAINVAIRIQPQAGYYGGAAFDGQVELECGPGETSLCDWSQTGVLATYSGGAWYRKTVTLEKKHTQGCVMLDLGTVAASAEIRVNGKKAGILVSPPWRVDISKFVKTGKNRIEVLVCNTLANHYVTIPSRYRGPTVSGLIGPASIVAMSPVELKG